MTSSFSGAKTFGIFGVAKRFLTRDRVIAQLRALAPKGLDWHVDVEYGRPSDEILAKARDRNASLIVIGLVHHGVVDRILDGDTALEVVRKSPVPVLLASVAHLATQLAL